MDDGSRGDINVYSSGEFRPDQEGRGEDEEIYGPELPISGEPGHLNHASGPTIPSLQDLQLREGRLSPL